MSPHAILPEPRPPHWWSPGLTPRQERAFPWIAGSLVLLILIGWAIVLSDTMESASTEELGPPPVARTIATSILSPEPRTPFLNEAALRFFDPLKGYSGQLTAVIVSPGERLGVQLPENPRIAARFTDETGQIITSAEFHAPERPGVWRIAVELDRFRRGIDDLSLITLVPFSEKRQGRIGSYFLGSWPYEQGGTPRSPAYANPTGFIRVTPENQDVHVSRHFQLKDFLTKDQHGIWPKYLLLSPKLIDKLELTIQELERRGVEVEKMHVMSGFRTPRYNHSGGNTAGRANLSRHMYGDAADVFVDNDEDGWTDDITGDGRVTLADAKLIVAAVDAVERKYPSLVGGVGIYPACCGHGPMVHIDVRGYRARWTY